MKSPLRPGHIERAQEMLLRGWSWRQIATYLNVHVDTIRSAIDPAHKVKVDAWRKQSEEKRLQARLKIAKRLKVKRRRHWGVEPDQLTPQSVDAGARLNIPDHVLADRDRRAQIEPASITAAVFGDPLPGRSALDQRKPRVAVSNQEQG